MQTTITPAGNLTIKTQEQVPQKAGLLIYTYTMSFKSLLLPACFIFACACKPIVNQQTNPGTTNIDSLQNDTLRITKAFKGIYRSNTLNKTFEACDQPGIIHKVENTEGIDSLFKKIYPNAYPGQGIYVEMLAEIHAAPKNSGPFIDVLSLKECTKAEQKNQYNTCILSDYWVLGMEPFWQLQISAKEGLIDFYNPMEQSTVHFDYANPTVTNNITTYSSSSDGNTIKIVIKKEKCNGAVDKQYEYSATIQLNGKNYSGCAIKSY